MVDSKEGSRTLSSVEVVAAGGSGSEELDEESQVEVPVIERVPGDSMSVTGESGGIVLLSESVPIMAVESSVIAKVGNSSTEDSIVTAVDRVEFVETKSSLIVGRMERVLVILEVSASMICPFWHCSTIQTRQH